MQNNVPGRNFKKEKRTRKGRPRVYEPVDEYDNATPSKSIVTVSDSELIEEMHCYNWVADNYEMRTRTIVN